MKDESELHFTFMPIWRRFAWGVPPKGGISGRNRVTPHRCERRLAVRSLVNSHTENFLFKSLLYHRDPSPTPLGIQIVHLSTITEAQSQRPTNLSNIQDSHHWQTIIEEILGSNAPSASQTLFVSTGHLDRPFDMVSGMG
jgi:hypothetical protein